jgi:dihydropteroate synthase
VSVRGFTDLGRTRVMGVVNATPDSFSDGGDHATVDAAVAHGLALVAEGADLVDVGGESTRPGAARVDVDEELARVVPVVRGLADRGVTVSVDTTRATVAAAALDAGAVLVNDVSAGVADPAMLPLVAERGVPYVAMHGRGSSADMQTRAAYADVVREVRDELAARLDACWSAGLAPDQVVLDPGLGFAKEADHNWALLRGLSEIAGLGRPLLVGASRKRFLGLLLGDGPEALRPPKERDDATTALTVVAAQAGAWAVRVHAVRPSADAVRVVERVARA